MKNTSRRIFKDIIFKSLVFLLTAATLVPLILILYHLIMSGIRVIRWDFIVNLPRPVGEPGSGIANAIAGTMILVTTAALMAVPVGVSGGIFLAQFSSTKTAGVMRFTVELLQGVPSIVIGIIAYAWVVIPMGSFSALSGSVALAIMMLPVIVRSTEETIRLIPNDLLEASIALGAPYYRTVLKVAVPAGMSGIVSGILLGLARITGETAPLLFTAFGNPFMTVNPLKPVNSLPLIIFNYATSPYPEWHALAWGASLILILMILLSNILAKKVSRK